MLNLLSDTPQFYNESINRYVDFNGLIEEITNYIKIHPEAEYKITVGTDSEGVSNTQFVTAIAILKIGNGGRYFWTKSKKIFCPTMQDRIYKEAMQSITLTQELKSRLKEKLDDNKIIVHLDVGKNGPTRDLIDSVVGMVRGYGLEAVIKPNSFCASVLADRHT